MSVASGFYVGSAADWAPMIAIHLSLFFRCRSWFSIAEASAASLA